jgi:hypothetical protein
MEREGRANLLHLCVMEGIVAEIEVVSNCDTVTRRDGKNFVLAITVKRSPLNRGSVLAPVVRDFSSVVPDGQFSASELKPCILVDTFMFAWKANNERGKLVLGTRGIDVGLEFVVGPFVDLMVSIDYIGWYIQLVHLCVHGSFREQNALDDIQNVGRVRWMKRGRKFGIVHFPSGTIVKVQLVLGVESKGCGVACLAKCFEVIFRSGERDLMRLPFLVGIKDEGIGDVQCAAAGKDGLVFVVCQRAAELFQGVHIVLWCRDGAGV